MTSDAVYVTENGEQYDHDEIERKEKCSFCGKLGTITGSDDYIDGNLPSLHSEGATHNYANICRNCLKEGVSKEEIDEAIGSEEELQEETVELS